MTGEEHFTEAERLVKQARDGEGDADYERFLFSAAQVHATLALAAYTKPPRGPRSNQGFG